MKTLEQARVEIDAKIGRVAPKECEDYSAAAEADGEYYLAAAWMDIGTGICNGRARMEAYRLESRRLMALGALAWATANPDAVAAEAEHRVIRRPGE